MAKHEEMGRSAARAYYDSQAYSGLTDYIRAEDAAKIFLPPVEEMLINMATPLPQKRKRWLIGFKEEQAMILEANCG